MAQKKTDRELLDDAIAAQEAGTYVDPVQAAKAFLSKPSVAEGARGFAQSEAAARKAAERLTPGGVAKTYGKVAKDTAVGAAIPASFLGGPVGMAAGGMLAMEGLDNAIEDPSMGNVAMAGVGMLPFAKPLRGLMKGAKEAKAVKGIRNTLGAGDMGATFSHERPYRAPSGVSGQGNMSMADLAGEGGTTPINWRKPPTAFDTLMGEHYPQAHVVDEAPVGQEMPGSADVQSMLAGLDSAMGSVPTAKAGPRLVQGASVPPQRPAGDFVHGADTSGGQFGFDHLPEISESELSRIQALFKRVTGR